MYITNLLFIFPQHCLCYNTFMLKKKFLFAIAILIWFLLFCDLIAFHYFLYWRFWWLDIFMHFLGGLWVSLFGYYIIYFSDFRKKFEKIIDKYSLLVISFVVILGVGFLWEVFELVLMVSLEPGYVFDTILDLIMDIAGWLAAYIFVLKKIDILRVAEIIGTDKIKDIKN